MSLAFLFCEGLRASKQSIPQPPSPLRATRGRLLMKFSLAQRSSLKQSIGRHAAGLASVHVATTGEDTSRNVAVLAIHYMRITTEPSRITEARSLNEALPSTRAVALPSPPCIHVQP
jgi:hypothetical protein